MKTPKFFAIALAVAVLAVLAALNSYSKASKLAAAQPDPYGASSAQERPAGSWPSSLTRNRTFSGAVDGGFGVFTIQDNAQFDGTRFLDWLGGKEFLP